MAISKKGIHLMDLIDYYEKRRGNTPNWNLTKGILGRNLQYMEYAENAYSFYGFNYAIECLMFSNSTVGTNIALQLLKLTPNEAVRKICLTDIVNPFQIPNVSVSYEGHFTFESTDKKTTVLEDDKFVVGIVDTEEKIHIYFLKK